MMMNNNDDGVAGFEMSIRILGNEFVGFVINVDDFKTKWLVLALVGFAGISATLAYFGQDIKNLFV